jgi:hypothetical protein
MRFRLNWALALVLACAGAAAVAAEADPVVASFATVGDSREEPSDKLNAQDRIWLQNTKAWGRMLREIQAQKPHALFFNGDMIMGYTTNKAELNRQYAYWRGMVTGLQESGVVVVPVPGNHEVQEKFKENGKTRKVARQGNEDIWRDNMGDLVLDSERWRSSVGSNFSAFDAKNAPAIGSADNISTDQSQLSYSFDFAGAHFAVINTDPVGNDGHAPSAWLKSDLSAAKSRGAKRMFVFGHKPAFTYMYKPGIDLEGLDNYPDNQAAFWQVIEGAGATYFCGHEHIYNMMQPWKDRGGKAWQVIVGSGGSPFSVEAGETTNPLDRTYAWALVKVHASGKTEIDTFGFDDKYGPTKQLQHTEF